MHFDRFDFLVDIQDVYILPTIRISTQYEMIDKNFNIQIHFAVFHFRWRWIHMKRAKKPTREQKELIAKQGLLPKNWMVILDDKKEMEIVSRKSRQHRVIKKVTG